MLLQRLRSMFDAAIDDDLMERNPARRVKNPRSRERKEPVEPFTLAEQTRIMDAAGEQERNFVALLIGTGLRPGELIAVRRKDVDLDKSRLVVSGSIGRFGEGTTKTGSTRIVDLQDKVAPVVAALLSLIKISNTRDFLFTNQNGRPLNFVNWRSRNWKDILDTAKVTYRSPYACRHTFAIRKLEAKRDVVYVARQLGHANTDMVHRHYARWTVSRMAEENL